MTNPAKTEHPGERLAARGGQRSVTTAGPECSFLGPQEIGREEIDAVVEVLKGKNLFRYGVSSGDSFVSRLEELFKEKAGVEHVLAVNSGTSALIAGLIGVGVSQGDEVLVPAYTYIATAAAVLSLGAFPVVVEIDESFTMDPEDMERKISPRTKAIIPVHMRGVPCEMEKIMEVARARKLMVLEDCAQANGGFFQGRALGTWGDAGAFSLQQFKIITAGEGGLVVSNSKEIFSRAAIYHDSAFTFWMESSAPPEEQEYWKEMSFLGQNFRQSEVHGAIGYEQLKKRDRILARTRAIKRQMWEVCENLPGVTMEQVRDRDGDCGISLALLCENGAEAKILAELLKAEGVPCGTKFSKDIPDRHLFYHWNYIIEKRTPHTNGFPWHGTDRPCAPEYSQEMCPKTLGIMERAVVFSINQSMSDLYVEQICAAIQKVGRAL